MLKGVILRYKTLMLLFCMAAIFMGRAKCQSNLWWFIFFSPMRTKEILGEKSKHCNLVPFCEDTTHIHIPFQ